ncbi:ABC transporter substrate-binding protein [Marmoricola endophyticus]|uniref:ABC transporter substrate-binding protein n=1 Tax=Marmoricola endophyticus TaxID=2040280 RepID=A0A917BIP6_9ACTN|nr:MCE family protein [Marmoricola endophyticus]GGF43335.1 ABC transporter substrate-binding protein [Marmoricola endophyticus]
MKLIASKLGIVAVIAVLALVVGLVLVFWPSGGKDTITADFPRTVSLYEGSDVKILGVPVGKVDKVQPRGTDVRVTISWDDKYSVPADAKAVLISPSIVGDRYVQLTPAYKGGAKLRNGAHLDEDRTATPVELDTIYSSLTQLSTALGPKGANKPDASGEGALTRLLQSTAANFGGQGEQVNQTIGDIARLSQTLDDNKDDLFGSVREIEGFVNTLARNDTTVRQFNDALSQASDLLAGERNDLAATLRSLSTALVDVRGFVRDNRSLLTKNIAGLRRVTDTFVKRRSELDEVLKEAPSALNNLGLAYNPALGTLDTRTNLLDALNKPGGLAGSLCQGLGVAGEECQRLLDAIGGGALPIGNVANGRAPALKRSSTPTQALDSYVDRSLGGLVEEKR